MHERTPLHRSLWILTALSLGLPALASAERDAGFSATATAELGLLLDDRPIADELLADGADSTVPATGREPGQSGRSSSVVFDEMIGDLVTTARRRPERVQATPVAVTAIAGGQLTARDVRRPSDLESMVPSFSIDRTLGTSNSGVIGLRGLAEGDFIPSIDQAVGVFLNGLYAPRAQSVLGVLYDVERVEVIRGPQGTLFGKNTIGGAVSITTREPVFEPEASAEVRIGNFDRVDSRFALNIPIVPEMAAFRLSAATNYDDGYQSNIATGDRLSNDRFLGSRAQLSLIPSENMEVLLMAEYSRQDRRPQGAKCQRVGAPSPAVQAVDDTIGFQDMCETDRARSTFKTASDLTFVEDDLRSTSYLARVTWDINDQLMLRWLSGFRTQDNDIKQDLDGSVQNLAQPRFDTGGTEERSYSTELQLNGRTMDGRVSYVLGLYAFGENNDRRLIAGIFSNVMPFNNLIPATDERTDIDNRSYAAYGQLSYAFTEKLDLSVGLRRTVERKRLRKIDRAASDVIGTMTGDVLLDFERSERFSDFSPNASLSYQATPDVLLYASYGTGFRSGGFNGRADSTNLDTGKIDSEELTSYELGFKTSFLDDRLIVNGATFYTIYEDIQRTIPTTSPANLPIVLVRNAAEARIFGTELEIFFSLAENLRIESVLSTLRSRYTDFDVPVASGTVAPGLLTLKDAPLVGSPDYLATAALLYDFDLFTLGRISSRVQWSQRGAQSNDIGDSRSVRTQKYGLLDGRVALALNDGLTEIAVYGRNLLNRRYVSSGIDFSDSVGLATPFFGPPRTYGIEVRRKFF